MLPSQYHYIKRMWTRNYPRRGSSILSKIFWFPLKLCIFITIAMIMTAFYILGITAWIVLVCLWELLKLICVFLKKIIFGLFKIIINFIKNHSKKESNFNIPEIYVVDDFDLQPYENNKPDLYSLGEFIIKNNEVNIPTIQRTFKLSYNNTINLLNELNENGVIKTNGNYNESLIILDMYSFNKMFQ